MGRRYGQRWAKVAESALIGGLGQVEKHDDDDY